MGGRLSILQSHNFEERQADAVDLRALQCQNVEAQGGILFETDSWARPQTSCGGNTTETGIIQLVGAKHTLCSASGPRVRQGKIICPIWSEDRVHQHRQGREVHLCTGV